MIYPYQAGIPVTASPGGVPYAYITPYQQQQQQYGTTTQPKDPNIYLRCKHYKNEQECYFDIEDNCFWNTDLDPPGCRYYVPSEGGPEGEPGDMEDCQLIKTPLKCKEATPNDALCMWDETSR